MKNKASLILSILGIFILLIISYVLSSTAFERKHFSKTTVLPNIKPPTKISVGLLAIAPDNIRNLKEISTLTAKSGGWVVAISESPTSTLLQAIYNNGAFIQWDMETRKVISNQELFVGDNNELPVYKINASINFNKTGQYLATPSGGFSNGLSGFAIWDTNSIEVLLNNDLNHYHSFILHPEIDMFIYESEKAIIVYYGFASNGAGGGSILTLTDDSPSITRLAVDSLGNYLAVVNNRGEITLGDISSFMQYPRDEGYITFLATYRHFECFERNVNIIDLKFDDTNSWLSLLTDENLVVWSLKNYLFPLYMNIELKGANIMSFDRTGQILAVATKDGIKIFDLAEKKEIAEYLVGDVTALYFTRDNRLLVWGDAQGVVHLWGVK